MASVVLHSDSEADTIATPKAIHIGSRSNTLSRPVHSHGHRDIFDSVKHKLEELFRQGNRRSTFEDITNNPKQSSKEMQKVEAETMEKAAKKPNKPFLTSQEYANEEVNFLMEKMIAYLYYPKDEADFKERIKKYADEYQDDLEKWTKEINDINI